MAKLQKYKKAKVIDQLRQFPIVMIAVRKCGVSTATYYRWRHEDLEFAAATDAAIIEGILVINDLAESKLISGINGGDRMMIMYWLNNRHPAYGSYLAQKIRDEMARLRNQQNSQDEEFLNTIKEFADMIHNVEGEHAGTSPQLPSDSTTLLPENS